jgi:flagellar biosynthesis chaperone FliJ
VTAHPLAALLLVRAREEAAARVALARAGAEEDRRRAERDAAAGRAEAHRARAEARVAVPGAPGVAAAELSQRYAFLERLRREAAALEAAWREADAAVARAGAETERCRAAHAAARLALRALERHRDRWEREVARLRERREEAASDDLVSARRAAP